MKNFLPLIFLTMILLVGPIAAQDMVLPPEGARIIANGPEGVVLQWPGSAKARYFVQIYTGTVAAVSQEVTGNRISVPLRAGLGYQWKVSLINKDGSYQEILPSRGFQVMTDTQVVLSGANGANGGLGNRRSNYVGLDGSPGRAGPALTATLTPMGGYVSLSITGGPANRLFYFAPGAGPLILASQGGQGGAGGPGYNGANGAFNFNTGFVTLPEPGGNGGDGGDGGSGGTIIVIANGLRVDDYLHFDVRGGAAGAPGREGRGGDGVQVPGDWQSRYLPQGYGYGQVRAPNGYPGGPGRPGPDGQVLVR